MATGGKMSARQRAARQRRRMILFVFEIIIILVMVAVLYLVMNKTSEGPKVTVMDPEKLAIPSQVQEMKEEGGTMHGYMNIALFGVDAQTDGQLFKGSRMNLDMDITDFVTVGYKGLSEVIDGLGGVYVDVDSEELKHINNYQLDVSNVLKCEYVSVTEPGYQLLNGVQAAAYCRIRQTKGDDFQRAARQREVIQAIEEQAKKMDLATLTKVFNDCIDDIYTSLDSKDILDLLGNIANYRIVEEEGFPQPDLRGNANMGAKGACVIPTDLVANVEWLHQFLFEDATYTVSDSVKEYSQRIVSDTSQYME